MKTDFLSDSRFQGITPFDHKVWLSSPTMHGDEQHWVDEAIRTNWVSTVGANINEVESQMASYVGRKYAVALSSGTAALHLAIRLAGERLYGQARPGHGTLEGRRVFCSDMTFDATVNPVAYEGGEAVYIDTERDTWNMCPEALEKAFAVYPDVRLIVVAHLYGTPGKTDELRRIAGAHGALIVEDAAESLGVVERHVEVAARRCGLDLVGDVGEPTLRCEPRERHSVIGCNTQLVNMPHTQLFRKLIHALIAEVCRFTEVDDVSETSQFLTKQRLDTDASGNNTRSIAVGERGCNAHLLDHFG